MTIAFTGATGLFTRIGHFGQFLADVNTYQGTLNTDTQEIIGQFLTPDQAMIDGISTQLVSFQNSASVPGGYLSQLGRNTLLTMVNADSPQLSNTNVVLAMRELIKQMNTAGKTIQSCAVTAPVATHLTNGNGVCVASVKTTDGFVQENTLAETIKVACTNDSSNNSGLAGNEGFTATGQQAEANVYMNDWPLGSSATASLSAINATKDNQQGNLLTNGDFENFSGNTPNNWSIITGTAGATILKGSSPYTGSHDLQIVGNGAELTQLSQTFNTSSGTQGALQPESQYAVAVVIKMSSVPAGGVLRISLTDGSNTVINDQKGTANSFSITLSGATTGYVFYTGVFRTPWIMPSSVKMNLKLTTALDNAVSVHIDHLGLGQMTNLYQGGPSLAVFSGSTNFYGNGGGLGLPDYFTVATTNDRGGASNNKTFQTLFDRLFNMKSLGLLLPSSGSPNISDSLIT